MDLITHIVAAEEDEIEALGESLSPLDEWSGMQVRDLDTAKIATMHAVLTGELYDDAVAHYEPVYASDDEGTLVLRLADELTQRLVVVDEDAIDAIAEELASTEDFEYEGWGADAIREMLLSLADLAQLAEGQGQALFVCMHPR